MQSLRRLATQYDACGVRITLIVQSITVTTYPTSNWSELLQRQTREAIEQLPVTLDGRMQFKHPTQGYAYAIADDLSHDCLALHSLKDEVQHRFDSVDALLQAGWVVD